MDVSTYFCFQYYMGLYTMQEPSTCLEKIALVSTQFRMVLTQIVTQVCKDSLSWISLHYLWYIVLQIPGGLFPPFLLVCALHLLW